MKEKYTVKRIVTHLYGLALLAFGISGLVRAQLGSSPLDAFNSFAHKLINTSFITFAIVVFITNAIMALVIYILTKRKELGISIIVSLGLSGFIQLWMLLINLIPDATMNNLAFQIGMASLATVSMGYGTAVLIVNDIALSPYDEVAMYVATKTNSIKTAKVIVDASLTLGALVLGLVLALTTNTPAGVSLGKHIYDTLTTQIFVFSIIAVIGVGPLINYFVNIIKKEK